MATMELKETNTTHEEHVADYMQASDNVDRNIHHPTGWLSWKLVVYRKFSTIDLFLRPLWI